jgi:hypothetical protein
MLPYPRSVGSQDPGATLISLMASANVTREEVADQARDFSRSNFNWGPGHCLMACRTCAGAPGGVLDANAAWAAARFKHTEGVAPRGTFVHWSVGDHGHIAVSDGLGRCWSTDVERRGMFDLVQISEITLGWNARLRGWAEDVNGVHPLSTEDDMPYTPQELRDALRPMVDNALEAALRAENPALQNAIRVAIEAERAEDAAAVWRFPLVNPVTDKEQAAGTFLRYSVQRLDGIRKWCESIGKAVKATPPS